MVLSSTKREIRHFHVLVVQRQQRNVQKSVMHVQSCCFANLNLLLFFLFWLPSLSLLPKLPNAIGKTSLSYLQLPSLETQLSPSLFPHIKTSGALFQRFQSQWYLYLWRCNVKGVHWTGSLHKIQAPWNGELKKVFDYLFLLSFQFSCSSEEASRSIPNSC